MILNFRNILHSYRQYIKNHLLNFCKCSSTTLTLSLCPFKPFPIISSMSLLVWFYFPLISRLNYFYSSSAFFNPFKILSMVLSLSSKSCKSLQFCLQQRSFSFIMVDRVLEFYSLSRTSFSSARVLASTTMSYFFLVSSSENLT